jgi:hypothetical protein
VTGSPKKLPDILTYNQIYQLAPALADVDGDGRNDIVLTANYWTGSGYYDRVYAYDLHGPAAHGPLEWSQLRGEAQRRGYYETGKNLASDAYLAIHTTGDGVVTTATPGPECQNHA